MIKFSRVKKYNIEPIVTLSHYEMPLNLVKNMDLGVVENLLISFIISVKQF